MWRLFLAGGVGLAGSVIISRSVWPFIRPKVVGSLGEAKVKRIVNSFGQKEHAHVHDILIPGGRDTTQIDHVLVSRYGVFVIETKNYSGIISGSESQQQWSQLPPSGRGTPRTFFNPLLQNSTHIKAIQSILCDYPNIPYHNIVAFGNNASLPFVYGIVKIKDLKLAITARCYGNPVLSAEDVRRIGKRIQASIIKGKKARDQHDMKANLAASAAKTTSSNAVEAEFIAEAKNSPILSFSSRGEPSKQPPPPELIALTDAGAFLNIRGRKDSIENFFEAAKRDEDGRRVAKGANFDHFICPYTGSSFPSSEAKYFYQGLWTAYLSKNPKLVEYLHEHITEHPGGSFRCQKLLAAYEKDPADFVDKARDCDWYRNISRKHQRKQPLSNQIHSAEQNPQKVPADKRSKTTPTR